MEMVGAPSSGYGWGVNGLMGDPIGIGFMVERKLPYTLWRWLERHLVGMGGGLMG